ncbi:MAG: Ig domain-containing protein, partial [Actinomycetota bacterium]|nr:Ig domain-containing protein [Actinomycetota bacterium]
MLRRLLTGGLTSALGLSGLLGLSAPTASARVAPAAQAAPPAPATALPGLHTTNLHAAYQRALPAAASGRPAGIVYPIGHAPHAAAAAGSGGCAEPACDLVYHGGPVQHAPKIYLLLWGPHWTSNAGQQATASYLESFYRGLGVEPQDTWSTITSQYGDATGSPAFGGSVFAGVWNDTAIPPKGATQNQLAAEANAFATAHHLTGDINAQIVIATQSGTCPSGFYSPTICGTTGTTGYCAWHDYAANTGVSYTNLPYLLDAGANCGENFINSGSAGTHDGFSMIGGHEYAESITDPKPSSGWIDTADAVSGGEIADKCAWHSPDGNVTLSTGSFAMQSLWSNAAGTCVMTPSSGGVSVTGPGSQHSTAGQQVRLRIIATSGSGGTLTFSAAGLPRGLKIAAATGLITGRLPMLAAPVSTKVTITVTGSVGDSGSARFTWTVSPVTGLLHGYRNECASDYLYRSAPGTPAVIRTC